MQWSIASAWSGQPAVDYTIVSSNDLMTVDPAAGSVGLDDTVVVSLDIACPAPSDEDVELRIAAGDDLLDAVWSVNCQGGSGRVRNIELYQGPMAVREVYEDDDSGETGAFQKETFIKLIPGRSGVVKVRVEHETDYLGEPVFSIVDGTDTSHLVETDLLSVTDPDKSGSGHYETEFMFPVSGSLFEPESTLRTDIDVDGSNEDPVREHVLALSDLSFFGTPLMRIQLFRMENDKGIPNIDTKALNLYMDSIMNFMPASSVEMTVEGVIENTYGESWIAEGVGMSTLENHWLEHAEPDEYYHGIFIYRRDRDPLGVAYLAGNVSMSIDLFHMSSSPYQKDANTFSHEMGHSFSLQHSPGCNTGGVDPNYPYDDGRLGPRSGWSSFENHFIEPEESFYDLQSYCRPRFISDYSFNKAAQYLSNLARLTAQSRKVLFSSTSDYAP